MKNFTLSILFLFLAYSLNAQSKHHKIISKDSQISVQNSPFSTPIFFKQFFRLYLQVNLSNTTKNNTSKASYGNKAAGGVIEVRTKRGTANTGVRIVYSKK